MRPERSTQIPGDSQVKSSPENARNSSRPLILLVFQLIFLAAIAWIAYYVCETIVAGFGSVELFNFLWISIVLLFFTFISFRFQGKKLKIQRSVRLINSFLLLVHAAFVPFFVFMVHYEPFKVFLYKNEFLQGETHSLYRDGFWDFRYTKLIYDDDLTVHATNPLLKKNLFDNAAFIRDLNKAHFNDFSELSSNLKEGLGRERFLNECALLFHFNRKNNIAIDEISDSFSGRILLLGTLLTEANPGNTHFYFEEKLPELELRLNPTDTLHPGVISKSEIASIISSLDKRQDQMTPDETELFLADILHFPGSLSSEKAEKLITKYAAGKESYSKFISLLKQSREKLKNMPVNKENLTVIPENRMALNRADYRLFFNTFPNDSTLLKNNLIVFSNDITELYEGRRAVYSTVTKTRTKYRRTGRYTSSSYTEKYNESVVDHYDSYSELFQNDTLRIYNLNSKDSVILPTPEYIYLTTLDTLSGETVQNSTYYTHKYESWLFGLPWSYIR